MTFWFMLQKKKRKEKPSTDKFMTEIMAGPFEFVIIIGKRKLSTLTLK